MHPAFFISLCFVTPWAEALVQIIKTNYHHQKLKSQMSLVVVKQKQSWREKVVADECVTVCQTALTGQGRRQTAKYTIYYICGLFRKYYSVQPVLLLTHQRNTAYQSRCHYCPSPPSSGSALQFSVSSARWTINDQLDQGSPNFFNKGPVYCHSSFWGAGLWPVSVKKSP